jgi:hypothetical protein
MLLGFRDFQGEKHLRLGMRCLRPEEAEMMEVAALWARVAAAAEVRTALCAAANQPWDTGTSIQVAGLAESCLPLLTHALFMAPSACRTWPTSG